MEFSEKLQLLRKQRGWTQEQLAERIYVSRTAISKWESGKGYPSIDSLKALAQVYEVTIDVLLSSEELMTVAEDEVRMRKETTLALLDVAALALVLLPLYGKTIDGYIYSAMLWAPPDAVLPVRLCYWGVALSLVAMGLMALYSLKQAQYERARRLKRVGIVVSVMAVPFFIATGEPYAATLMFVLLLAKGLLLYKPND
ncbi:MAG: helix-turn-helix transcriptional regulator [Peptococcaceae bacterium]